MISICIPVYNFNIASLLNGLAKQIKMLPAPCEIICIDDASEESYRTANSEATKGFIYIQLQNNIGRAKIRNLFMQYAKYENLLFLDCDSLIVSGNFLSAYLQYIDQHKGYAVVCGGRIYSEKSPDRKYQLRWLYGIKTESLPADKRSKNPNASFMTNNFIISKNVFLQTPFDERIIDYGHEDTLLGYTLQKKGIIIHHISNSVLNGHLEMNEEYLAKTKQAVINLTHILAYVHYDKTFINHVSLLRFYYKAKPLESLIRIVFAITQPVITWLLANGYVSLGLFAFYKLGIFTKNIRKQS